MQPAYVVELALELELLVCPCGAHQSNRLIRIGPAPFVGSVKRPELLFQPAGAQTRNKPSAAKDVDRRQLLRQMHCVAIRHHDHAGADFDLLRHGRDVSERRQRLEQVGGPDRTGLRRHQDMVAHPYRRITRLLGMLRDFRDVRGRFPELRQMDSDSHFFQSIFINSAACAPCGWLYGPYNSEYYEGEARIWILWELW